MIKPIFRNLIIYLIIAITLNLGLATTTAEDLYLQKLNPKNINESKSLQNSSFHSSWCAVFRINESGFDASVIHVHISSSDDLMDIMNRIASASSGLLRVVEANPFIAAIPELEWELTANADGSRDLYIISGTKELPRDTPTRIIYSWSSLLKKDYAKLIEQYLNTSSFIDITFIGYSSNIQWKPTIGYLGEGKLDESFLLQFLSNKGSMMINAAVSSEIRYIADKYRTYTPTPDRGEYIILGNQESSEVL